MNRKEQYVMDNFKLNRPDPADFDTDFVFARMREGHTTAEAMKALGEYKRKERSKGAAGKGSSSL